MTTITMSFDTLKFFENLQKAGMQKEVAKCLTEEMKNIQEQNIEQLATKQDVEAVTLAVKFEVKKDNESLSQKIDTLDKKIDYVEERLNQKMQSLEYKLTVKIGAMITIAVAAITWLNKILV